MLNADFYQEFTDRNIGLLTKQQQDKLRDSCVAIFGLGGLGGVVAEVICRSGVGKIKMSDHGDFEASNITMQFYECKLFKVQCTFRNKASLTETYNFLVDTYVKERLPGLKERLLTSSLIRIQKKGL